MRWAFSIGTIVNDMTREQNEIVAQFNNLKQHCI